MKTKLVNKDGTANKKYVQKLWNHAINAFCATFNDELSDEDFVERTKEFQEMVDKMCLEIGQQKTL